MFIHTFFMGYDCVCSVASFCSPTHGFPKGIYIIDICRDYTTLLHVQAIEEYTNMSK